MPLQSKIYDELISKGVEFIRFVDISHLSEKQNKGYSNAILFGIPLTPTYLKKVGETIDYVKKMIQNKEVESDEFHLIELKTDQIADELARFLQSEGYEAYSQSEKNIEETGYYDKEKNRTPLPHKTIATHAGLGWIGKHNLLVTNDYGSALSMCSVLTNAPLETVSFEPTETKCGACNVCVQICPEQAIKGNLWTRNSSRDEIIDVRKCFPCLQCMVHCPHTQKYIKSNYSRLP